MWGQGRLGRRTAPDAGGNAGSRTLLLLLSLGAVAVVLVALPYKAFDLDRFFVPKELVLHITALLAAVTLLARARQLQLTRVDALLAAYLILCGISAAFATNSWLAGRALAISFSGAVVFWAARAVARSGRGRILLGALALAIAVVVSTALLQAYGVRSEYVSLNRAPGGTLGNRNFVAHLAAVGAPVLVMFALSTRRMGAVLATGGIALSAAVLVLTRSRAAWLALAACGALALLAAIGFIKRWRGSGIGMRVRRVAIGGVLGVGAALLLPNTLNWRSDSPYLDSVRGVVNYRDGSGRGRLVQYKTTLRMALDHPLLGVGPGNWPVWYPRHAAADDPSLSQSDGMTANPWPSSDWMALLSERGVPAVVCLALALLGLVIGALVALVRARSTDELLAPLTLLLVIVAAAVVSSFDAALLLPAPAVIVWALLGALAPPARARLTIDMSGRRGWWVLGAVAVGTVASARSASQIAAMDAFGDGGSRRGVERAAELDPGSYRIHLRLAQSEVRRGRCAGVREHAGRALALFPRAPEPRRLLAACGGCGGRGQTG